MFELDSYSRVVAAGQAARSPRWSGALARLCSACQRGADPYERRTHVRFGYSVQVFFLSLLAGCVSTAPINIGPPAADAACVKGYFATLSEWFADRAGHVFIKEIDGVPTGQGNRQFCFAPGKHQLGIQATATNYQEAQDFIEFEFAPTRKYLLHGRHQGISFLIELEDVTTQPSTKLTEFKLRAGSSGTPVVVPVPIPSR